MLYDVIGREGSNTQPLIQLPDSNEQRNLGILVSPMKHVDCIVFFQPFFSYLLYIFLAR